jgi:hypothetical protein
MIYLRHRPEQPSAWSVIAVLPAAEPPLSTEQSSGGVGLTPEGPAECGGTRNLWIIR